MGPRMRTSHLACLALLSLPVGCNIDPGHSVAMQDSLELTVLGPAQEDLHTPYVTGSTFDITVAQTDYSSSDTAGWSLKSSDPTVVSVAPSSGGLNFPVTAVGTGHATLTVVDPSGKVLDSHDVEVAQPDNVQLAAHGPMVVGQSDSQAQVTQATVVQGGVATLLVRYFRGSQELYGNGAVTTTSTGSVTAMTTTSSFADARDWIEVDGGQVAGPGQVALAVGGSTVATIPALVVPASSITSVGTLAESDAHASDGQTLHVFARAFDAQGSDIYGASFQWQLGGAALGPAPGNQPSDVFAYQYKGGATEIVTTSLDGYTSSLPVHGAGGTVSSSEATGCSIARTSGTRGEQAGTLGLVLCAALAFAGRRRRSA
jgi:hypothetical protein